MSLRGLPAELQKLWRAAAHALPGGPPSDDLTPAPLPPRPIADSYACNLRFADGWFLAGLVFGILGVVFGCVGIVLTVTLMTLAGAVDWKR